MPESVWFYSSSGLKLAGDLYVPDKTKRDGNPAVVLCQGLSGVKHKVLPEVASHFCSKGLAVLAFDYRGFGESDGEKERLFPMERVEDAMSALSYIRSRSEADPSRIGLYGLSYGGATALYGAALDRHVKCVVAVSGAIDGIDLMRGLRNNAEWIAFKKILEADRAQRAKTGSSSTVPVTDILPFSKNFWSRYARLENKNHSESIPEAHTETEVAKFTVESAEVMTEFNVSHIVGSISPRPALFIQGEDDDVVPIEDVRKVFGCAGPPKELVELPGCDHIDLDHGPGFDHQVELSLEWLKKYL